MRNDSLVLTVGGAEFQASVILSRRFWVWYMGSVVAISASCCVGVMVI